MDLDGEKEKTVTLAPQSPLFPRLIFTPSLLAPPFPPGSTEGGGMGLCSVPSSFPLPFLSPHTFPCSTMAPSLKNYLSRTAPSWAFHGLQCDYLLQHGPLHGLWRNNLLPRIEESSALMPGDFLPSFFTDIVVCRAISLTFFSSVLSAVLYFYPFLIHVPLGAAILAAGPAMSSTGPPSLSSQRSPAAS